MIATYVGAFVTLPRLPVHAGGVGPVQGEDVEVEIISFISSLVSLCSPT